MSVLFKAPFLGPGLGQNTSRAPSVLIRRMDECCSLPSSLGSPRDSCPAPGEHCSVKARVPALEAVCWAAAFCPGQSPSSFPVCLDP